MSDNMKYDVIIVGAGVFGMATAFYLKQTDRALNVMVIDREGGAGEGNTCKSAAGIRNTFSSPENVILTNTSINKFEDIEKKGFGLNIKMCGYLWLMTDDKFKKSQDAIYAMKENGVDFSVLFAEELRAIPGLNIDNYSSDECQMMGLSRIKSGLLGKKCGSIDPGAIVSYYENEFKKLGGITKFNTKVESLILEPEEKLDIPGEPLVWQEPKIAGVRTANGEIYA
ncbi:MAG TPA: FAD-dependent oxidoreductase, partial [Candidatus Wallbacteria bacterium]|nr:FAD-dependent oxidoreductase [Candidatus Wallbacteria bacterium]